MKIKHEGIIYDVVDTYAQGFIVEKQLNEYKYSGLHNTSVEIINDSPIGYVKSKKYLEPKKASYSKTIFINEDHINGSIEQAEDTIVVYNNVVVFYAPARGCMLVLDIKKTARTGNKYVWGFERHEDNTISLSPSIRFTAHDHSEHFFIKRNKVVSWCRDSWETVYIKRV